MKLSPLLILLFSISLSSQELERPLLDKDSIIYYLKNAKGQNDYSFNKRAFELSLNTKDDSLKKESAIEFGLSAYFKRDTVGINKSIQNLMVQYEENKDSTLLAKVFHYKALYFRVIFLKDSSYYYYHKSKNISKLLQDSLQIGRRLLSMGYMQNDESDYVGAQNTLTDALRYLETQKKATRFIGDSYCAIGNAISDLGDYKESRKYYYKAKEVFDTVSNEWLKTRWRLIIMNNLGNSFLLENNPKKAINYFKDALLITDSIQFKHPNQYRTIVANIGDCYYDFGDKEKAMNHYMEVLKLREADKEYFGLSKSHNGISYRYESDGQYAKALFHAKKAYKLAKMTKNTSVLLSSLIILGRLTREKKSKEYYNEYIQVSDSINTNERYYKNQYARIRFETEKIDKENTDLKLENIEKEAEISSEKQQKIISWLISLAAILGFGLSINFFRTRRKQLIYQAQLQKAVAREEERQQIAKSLHDEVAGDLRILHQKLSKTSLGDEAENVKKIKNNVRNLSHQLSSVSFDEVSFKDQIINLISDHFSMDFKIRSSGIDMIDWKSVNETIMRTLYLSIRESLQNTIKYAEATQFLIEFSLDKREIVLHLKDNGKGIDPNKEKKGIGLKNLKERVEEIQGSFHISSSKEGTEITLKIPMNGK